MKTISACVVTALAMAVYVPIAREEFHIQVFRDDSAYYAVVKYGPLIDMSAELWVMENNKWLLCPVVARGGVGIYSEMPIGRQLLL